MFGFLGPGEENSALNFRRRLPVLALAVVLGGLASGGSSYLPTGSRPSNLASPGSVVPGYGGPVSELASGNVEPLVTNNELEAASSGHASAPQRVRGSFIVALAAGQNPRDVAATIAREYGGESGAVYDEVINGFNFLGPDDAGKRMASDPRIRSVQPDYEMHLAESSASTHLAAINQPPAIQAGNNGHGVRIGILDTGADFNHTDIKNNLSSDSTGSCVGATSAQDLNGHGTRTTSNAVGLIGVAPAAQAVVVKVFSGSGTSTTFANIACGVNYIVGLNKNATASKHVQVVNASIAGSAGTGSCNDGSLRQAVCDLVNGTDVSTGGSWAPAAFFAAAGNSGASASGYAPANYPEANAISAFDCDSINCTTTKPKLASFSNRGATIDLGAPGVNIWSAKLGGGHETASGTSRSSPLAAGAAADLVSAAPGLSPSAIKAALQKGAKCPDFSVNGNTGDCTHGGDWTSDDTYTEPFLNVAGAIGAVAPPTVPGAPLNVSAVAGNAQATVSWVAPSNGGSTITKYTVTGTPGGTATVTGSPPATTATVTLLTNGTPYTFKVTATNSVGDGPASNASNSVTPTTTPPPPVAANKLTAGNSAASGTTVSTAAISPTANALQLAAIDARSTTANTVPTLSGCNLTWVQVTNGSVAYHSSPFKRLTLFSAQGSSPSSSCTLTFSFGSTTMTNFLWTVSEFTNVPVGNNGAAAVVQAASGLGSSGTASVTLASFASSSATFGVTGTDGNSAVTQGSGFTELHEQVSGYTTLESEWRSDPSQTVSSTFGSVGWGIIGVEIAHS
jgi:hypothetical protein